MEVLSDRSKTVKYISVIVLALCFILLCNAQPAPRNSVNVNDFHSATWNTNGAQWGVVRTIMGYGLDVLAIQEAGSINTIIRELATPRNSLPICFGGFHLNIGADCGVTEHIWGTGSQTLYIYYYEIKINNPTAPGNRSGNRKQNMAIVTRQRAEEIIVIPPEVRHTSTTAVHEEYEDRSFINRPVVGIRIANSVFFNIHPEPNRVRNEAPILINAIQNYVETYYPGQTYMVMGDFNRTPQQLQPQLPRASNGRFISVLHSGQNTRETGELDYSVVGGPIANRGAVIAISAQLLQMRGVNHTSDHTPVRFN